MERNYKIFLLVLLGAFTAFAPLINNTLGPILGLVAKHFDSTQAVVNIGFTASMIGLAAGQLVLGPLSDKYGRRRPLILSVTLFSWHRWLWRFPPAWKCLSLCDLCKAWAAQAAS